MRNSLMYDLLRRPVSTEKSSKLSEVGKYVFIIRADSTKPQIKKAVGEIFGVSVCDVNIINTPRKSRKFKGVLGTKCGYKKAIVTTDGQKKIDFSIGI